MNPPAILPGGQPVAEPQQTLASVMLPDVSMPMAMRLAVSLMRLGMYVSWAIHRLDGLRHVAMSSPLAVVRRNSLSTSRQSTLTSIRSLMARGIPAPSLPATMAA